jgi:hypothetical protein
MLAAYEPRISHALWREEERSYQDKPIASIDDASAHVATFAASEIQYAT